jgi:ubiquinone/menaquinone biosynthesis C-methylase UbiE
MGYRVKRGVPTSTESQVSEGRYIPAAGWRVLTPLFDPVMAVTTRVRRWRGEVVDESLATSPGTILDVGCGTGTLAMELARRAPQARVIGLDGNPDILTRAAAKTREGAVEIELLNGLADSIPLEDASVDCAISTLVFHHLSPATKVRALAEIRRVLRPDGRLVIADYGGPHDPPMRLAFLWVQLLDGFQNTRQHAAGQLPELIADAGFDVQTVDWLRTISGTLELLAASPNVPSRKDEMSTEAKVSS